MAILIGEREFCQYKNGIHICEEFMTVGRIFKKQALFLLALFVLFITQFLFFRDELDFTTEDQWYALAELAAFFFFFSMSLLRLSRIVQIVLAVLLCFGLSVLRAQLFGFQTTQVAIILVYAPICCFFLSQDQSAEKGSAVKRKTFFLVVYPVFFLGALLFFSVRDLDATKQILSAGINYSCFLFLALILLYGIIMRIPPDKKNKESKLFDYMREDCLFAIITIVESFLLLRVCDASPVYYTTALFWLAVLPVLYVKGNPILCTFCKRTEDKLLFFIKNNASSSRSESM